MAKQLMFDEEARQKIQKGVNAVTEVMRITLGPSGRNVILEKKFGAPESIKDGNDISKEIELVDPFENMGAKMVAEAASRTSDVVGDGTTTAAVLTRALYEEGLKYLAAGANPMLIKKGIDRAVQTVTTELKKMSRPIKNKTDYQRIATISAHYSDLIGQLVADAMEKVGTEGTITVEEGKGRETTLEFVEGLQFDKGYLSPYFINNPETLTCTLDDSYILLYEKKISNVQEILPLLEAVHQTGRPLLIIAEEVEGEALTSLILNKLNGILRVAATKAPAFGDRKKAMLEDIAVLTGGRLISDELGLKLENITLDDLGRAQTVRCEKENTAIVGGQGDKKKIEERIQQIRNQIKQTTSDYDREKLEERLAKLTGGVAVIKVGALMESVLKEKKALVNNAVHSAQAAREEGILPGGGTAYLKTIPVINNLAAATGDENEKFGINIVARALDVPLKQIAANAGFDGGIIVEELKERNEPHLGFDAVSGKFVNMLETGIIDSTKFLRVALQNAASIAGLMLTSCTLVTDLKEKKKKIEGSVR
ncbi:MAG: chaperonin GroEL [Planctomycetota bacterium]